LRRFSLNFACFLGGLGVTSAALYALVPHDRPTLDQALAKRKECGVLIVGPSYIELGIKEESFEREAARVGLGRKPCKYAMGAFQGYEVRHGLELLLEQRWPKLKEVLIDLTLGDNPEILPGNEYTARVVDWHTWSSVPWLLDYYRTRSRQAFWTRMHRLGVHAQHVAMNYLGVGRAIAPVGSIRLLERRTHAGTPDRKEEPAHVPPYRGRAYEALRDSLVAKKAQQRRRKDEGDPTWASELQALVLSKRKRTPVFLISPVLYARMPPRGTSEGQFTVLDFEDPQRFPELYVEKVRGRTNHLTEDDGAELYSQALARELARVRHER
jgi:hypothetical protein